MTDYATVSVELAALTGMATAVHAAIKPEKMAVTDQHGKVLTWSELNGKANQLARYFLSVGIEGDDGVALLCGNRSEYAIVFMAAMRSGVRLTPINWHLTSEEVGYIVGNCNARVFLADTSFAETAGRVLNMSQRVESGLSIGGDIAQFDAFSDILESFSSDNIPNPTLGGGMLYTSGTTGKPKGVYRKESPPILPDYSERGYASGNEVALCTGPAYHAAPLLIDVLTPLISGASLVMMDRWDPEQTLKLISEHKVTHSHMVATMFHRLLRLDESIKRQYNLSSLKRIIHGAAPCPVHIKHEMIDWFGPVLIEYYAATEGGGGFLIDSHEWLTKPGSVGRPGPEFDNKIVDDEGNDVSVGVIGTIYMHAPDSGRFEYYKDDSKTSSSYRGDYFTLGDMGYFDEDGYLFLTGRTAELIISGGVNIYPQEVDSRMMQHPAVQDVCTIGVPNAEWGEEVKSVVQLKPDSVASEDLAEQLIAFTREHIAGYKCPKTVDFVTDLPRLPTGKIQRRIVREPYWAGHEKSI
tara:strand:- start:1857 stop:3428 length:1572 start_codon:yes stop_codon:yes gene_type:complete